MAGDEGSRWSHRPGLDGVRGLAVTAVVAYHLGYLSGGFLGVDVFLVLSGFLITGLAIGEIGDTGGLSLRAFWGRRVRRLLPALLVVVTVVVVVALAIGWPRNRLHALGWDGIATLTWWANWRQVQGPSYWASGENLFRHAWSLSIEEQFYLVWPVVLVGCAAVARRAERSVAAIVGGVALAGAVVSASWQLVLSHRIAPEDLSRVYVGTDARAVAPLLGCALACLLAGERRRLAAGVGAKVAGAIGSVVLLWLIFTAEVASPSLYRNGVLVLASLCAVAVVARSSAVEGGDRSPLAWASTARATRYLGLRSYALYLWSWPIQVLIRFQWPDLAKGWVAAITVGLSLALAEASYRWLEYPIRRRTGWAAKARFRRPAWGAALAGAATVLIVALVLAVPPPLHERIDTAQAAAAALHREAPPTSAKGLKVMVTGDSVSWTVGYYAPRADLPPGIASIDSRAIIGCGLLSVDGWGYPQGGEGGPFTTPGSGKCREEPTAEAIGLKAKPDVVLLFPGSWEWSKMRTPNGVVIPARSPQLEAALQDRILRRITAANEAGARFVAVAYSCPGQQAAGVRKDPEFIDWFNTFLRRVVKDAARNGARAEVLEPTKAVCIDGDAAGDPTPAKKAATADEIHIADKAGGSWIWNTWLAPALTRK